MKPFSIINRYIFKETILTFVFTVGAFMFLLYTGSFLKMMEMGLPFLNIVAYTPFMLLSKLPYVIPLGFITGYVITFSRLTADREIQVIRVSGIPLMKIIGPHLVLALCASLAAAYMYQAVIPVVNQMFHQRLITIFREIPPITETYNQPSLLLNQGRDQIYVINRDGDAIKGLTIQHIEDGRLKEVTFAEHASIYRTSKDLLTFSMTNVNRLVITDEYIDHPQFKTMSIDVPLGNEKSDKAAGNEYGMQTGDQLQQTYRDHSLDPKYRQRARVEYWLRIALASACLVFTVFAIPSGIYANQRSKATGFIRSLLYALIIFFPLLMGIRSYLLSNPQVHPNIILAPAWLFLFTGIYRLRKVLLV